MVKLVEAVRTIPVDMQVPEFEEIVDGGDVDKCNRRLCTAVW